MLHAMHTTQQQQQHPKHYNEQDPGPKKRQIQDNLDDSDDAILQPCLGSELTRQKTPTATARDVIVKALVSHPKPIQDLLLSTSGTFNALASRLQQQEQTSLNMSKEAYVPHSAQITFHLKALESVMEKNDYATLTATMDTALKAFKMAAKTAICAVAKLEVENTKQQIAKIFTSTAQQLAKLLLLQNDPETELNNIILAALALETHGSTVTKYSCMSLNDALTMLFLPKTYNGLNASEAAKATYAPFINDFTTLMTAAFVTSWASQLDYHKRQASDCIMSKQVKDFLDGNATQQAAATMDTEPTADPALLKDIIKKQVDCQQKKMQAEINKLRQMVARSIKPADTNTNKKNLSWGANTKKGAPSTKKTPPSASLKSALKKPNTTNQKGRKKHAAMDVSQGDALRAGKAAFKLQKKAPPEQGRKQKPSASRNKQSKK